MNKLPKILKLSLRIEPDDTSTEKVMEETRIIRVYDCYSSGSKDRGDKYCHYYIASYVSDEMKGIIDPNLKICCSKGKLYYSNTANPSFKELKGKVLLYMYDRQNKTSSKTVIGRLEQIETTI